MRFYIMKHKKIKYYLLILAVLWSGVLVNKVMQSFVLEEASVNAQIKEEATILLKKTYQEKLTISQKEKIATEVLNKYDADIVDAIKTEELFTIYAYSNQFDSYIIVGNQNINLNLVYYYNEITNETTLILSTNIYNEDY